MVRLGDFHIFQSNNSTLVIQSSALSPLLVSAPQLWSL